MRLRTGPIGRRACRDGAAGTRAGAARLHRCAGRPHRDPVAAFVERRNECRAGNGNHARCGELQHAACDAHVMPPMERGPSRRSILHGRGGVKGHLRRRSRWRDAIGPTSRPSELIRDSTWARPSTNVPLGKRNASRTSRNYGVRARVFGLAREALSGALRPAPMAMTFRRSVRRINLRTLARLLGTALHSQLEGA